MPSASATLCYGRIVWADLPDSQGVTHKDRPAVVITPTDQIQPNGDVRVACISTKFDQAPADVSQPEEAAQLR